MKLKRWKDTLIATLLAIVLGEAMAMTLCDAMSLPVSPIDALLPCVMTAVCCSLMSLGTVPMLLTLLGLSGLGGIAVWQNWPLWQSVQGMFSALFSVTRNTNVSIANNAPLLMNMLSISFTMVAFMVTQVRGGVYPAMLLLLGLAIGGWMFAQKLNVYYMLPALGALAVLFARSGQDEASYGKAIPMALIAVLTAALLAPWFGVTDANLKEGANRVRELVNDYILFSDQRISYSLRTEGYQPSSEQLGGDANPSDYPIMDVETDTSLLLRGSIKRDYTGSAWVDDTVKSRHLFASPLRNAIRAATFGVDMPSGQLSSEALNGIYEEKSAKVTFLSRGTSTIFAPYRITSFDPSGEEMVAYFNTPGEMFITRSIRPGDGYSFSSYVITADANKMDAFLKKCAAATDSNIESVYANYMTVPSTIDPSLITITQNITGSAATPFRKALAIQSYLRDNYTYTLSPGPVPAGRDFVSYFINDNRMGYCTYFASAMGVMARLAGMPSRYIEGYSVSAEEDGETEVSGKDAHAWVEIYFKGFGWVSFDPTPLSNNGSGGGSGSGFDLRGDEADDKDGDGDESGDAQPSPTPQSFEIIVDIEPEVTPEPESVAPSFDVVRILWQLLMAAIVIVVLLALTITLRLILTRPNHIADKLTTASDKLLVYYRAALTALEMQGQSPNQGETPMRFAVRVSNSENVPGSFVQLTRGVVQARYANVTPTASDLTAAADAYTEISKALHFRERLRWYRRRVRHGIGNTRRIP